MNAAVTSAALSLNSNKMVHVSTQSLKEGKKKKSKIT